MSGNDKTLAIAALFTVGIALLNLGLNMVMNGDTYTGIVVMIFGAVFILLAVLVTKMLAMQIAAHPPTPP